MPSKKSSPLPLLFRAAAFYAFFSIFFLNAQPFFADWNNPFGTFIRKMNSVFSSTEAVQKSGEEIAPNAIVTVPDPPPPPPPSRPVGKSLVQNNY
jgi:hypothetical protein